MKVLHINANYLYTNLHQCMNRSLAKLGIDNQVFVPIYTRSNLVVTPDENVNVSVCYKKWDRFFFYNKQKKIKNALMSNFNVSDFDLLHAYTLFTDGNCAYELSKKYNIPYVVAVRNTDVNSFFKFRPHLIGRGVQIMRNAKFVFFLSDSYKQQVLQKYIPSQYRQEIAQKSCIIPNGIDEFWLQHIQNNPRSTVNSPLRLVYAGRIDKNKNIATTQEAMKILGKRGYESQLTVVGKVADKGVFQQICNDKHTSYHSPVDVHGLIDIYRNNDIFVMPSFTESFGLVYAEAISQGLPVVYSAGEGFDNQFDEGEVGFRADPHSAESVADAIEKIVLNYSEITKDISQKAMTYNWDHICAQYCEIYQSILLKR